MGNKVKPKVIISSHILIMSPASHSFFIFAYSIGLSKQKGLLAIIDHTAAGFSEDCASGIAFNRRGRLIQLEN